ncbi:hypothetical protein [Variovorax sp. PCZ-1]|uniref:hypothetical protein n=1 Tax=Variovorax sp. PCZ-1 TaxID=2835533 RepID=UPI001BD0F67E|nr:hypothetical protein [Variovorax sp. PCZ-1]MBS7807641.1 hypothetical protein [Variovorax sp. PCZ-1]
MVDTAVLSMKDLLAVLPAYVNGSATTAEQAQVKHALKASHEARAALAWHEALAEKVVADVESVRGDIGWSQLQAKVRASQGVRNQQVPAAKSSLWARLEVLLPHRWLSARVLGGACAALLAVVIGQGILLSADGDRAYSEVRSAQSNPSATGTAPAGSKYIKINFKEKITERDMRLMLVRSGAVIVYGPAQLGDYTVAVPAAELDATVKLFKDSMLTESVQETAAPGIAASSDTTGSALSNPAQEAAIKKP